MMLEQRHPSEEDSEAVAATAMHAVVAAGGERLSRAANQGHGGVEDPVGTASSSSSSSSHLLATLLGATGTALRAARIRRQQQRPRADHRGPPLCTAPLAALKVPFCNAVGSAGGAVVRHMLGHDAQATAMMPSFVRYGESSPGSGQSGSRFLSEMLELVLCNDGESDVEGALGSMLAPCAALAAKALMRGAKMAATLTVPLPCISALVGALVSLQHDSLRVAAGGETSQRVAEPSALQVTESGLISALTDAISTLSTDLRQSTW